MSLLHRNLLATAFSDMLKKFEPIVKDTLETAVNIASPQFGPLADVLIEEGDTLVRAHNPDIVSPGAVTSSHVDAVSQAAAVAAPAPAATVPLPVVNDQNSAALAAVNALQLQLSQIATQLAALAANIK